MGLLARVERVVGVHMGLPQISLLSPPAFFLGCKPLEREREREREFIIMFAIIFIFTIRRKIALKMRKIHRQYMLF
jgi:hypothetical protein